MTDNVVTIVPAPTVQSNIVKLFEALLEKAKAGEIHGTYIVTDGGGNTWTSHEIGYSKLQMLGILEVAKVEYIRDILK